MPLLVVPQWKKKNLLPLSFQDGWRIGIALLPNQMGMEQRTISCIPADYVEPGQSLPSFQLPYSLDGINQGNSTSRASLLR